jgi:predicted lysophospholipase L1 biosynthesis ABC-type transport system permease subunit
MAPSFTFSRSHEMATILSSRTARRSSDRSLSRLAQWLDETGLVALLVAVVALVAVAGYEARALETVPAAGIVLAE